MLDEHGNPLPEWRAKIRRRLAERGYNIDWAELETKKRRLAALVLVVGFALLFLAWLLHVPGFR